MEARKKFRAFFYCFEMKVVNDINALNKILKSIEQLKEFKFYF